MLAIVDDLRVHLPSGYNSLLVDIHVVSPLLSSSFFTSSQADSTPNPSPLLGSQMSLWPDDGRLLPASNIQGPAGFPPVTVRASVADLLPSRSLLHQDSTDVIKDFLKYNEVPGGAVYSYDTIRKP